VANADVPAAAAVARRSREELTLEAVLAADIEVFRDDEPFLRLPPEEGGGEWPLRSPRVRDWLALVCWRASGQLLKPREADALLWVLSGQSWLAGAQPPPKPDDETSLWEAVERDPVVQAALELVSVDPSWEGTMTNLYDRLTHLAEVRRIIDRHTPWPRIAATFGARLRRQAGLLERAGVELQITRGKRGTLVKLVNLELAADAKKGISPICPNGPPGSAHKLDLSPFSPSGVTPAVAREASTLNLNPDSDLSPDFDDRPKRATWPAPPLKRKQRKGLPSKGGAGDAQNRARASRRPKKRVRPPKPTPAPKRRRRKSGPEPFW
jgi:hypothetical protein